MTSHFRTYRQRSFYMLESEYSELKRKAKMAQVGVSEYVRNAVKKSRLVNKKSIPDEQYIELGRIGNNLNQIAKHYNTYSQTDIETTEKIEDALEFIKTLKLEMD